MTTLSAKTALVTGASRGIGRASALALRDARWITGDTIHVDGGSKL
jgi:NADP-dependent 3-hydroxy acid dehydrogenase YdfG